MENFTFLTKTRTELENDTDTNSQAEGDIGSPEDLVEQEILRQNDQGKGPVPKGKLL